MTQDLGIAVTGVSGIVLMLLLAGCVTPQTQRVLADPASLRTSVELAAVPFFPQDEFQCGPASLAMALGWTGVAVAPEALTPQVYLSARRGSLQAEMVAAARRYGRVGYVLRPLLEDLLHEVAAGNPVIVLQNLAFNWFPVWHYAVVIGYDLGRREIILRSGRQERLVLALDVFERTWRRGDHWAFVVVAPGHVPATAEERPLLQAVAGLERLGRQQEAAAAYRAALRRWPDSLPARIGLANSLYTAGDLADAERVYRETLARHPDAGVAYNNLAQILAEQGRLREAEDAVRRAVALGGPLRERYAETLGEIRRARAAAR